MLGQMSDVRCPLVQLRVRILRFGIRELRVGSPGAVGENVGAAVGVAVGGGGGGAIVVSYVTLSTG